MNKENLAFTNNGMLFSLKWGGNAIISSNTVQGNKPDSERQILHDLIKGQNKSGKSKAGGMDGEIIK
jgi:hypothetical protein